MTTWTMSQIHAVRALYIKGFISELARRQWGGELEKWFREDLAAQLANEARSLAVEMSPRDVAFTEGAVDEETLVLPITGAWRPSTHDAQMLGGPEDGRIFAVHNIWDVWRTASIRSTLLLDLGADDPSPIADNYGPIVTDYQLAGWLETERRWVFTPTGAL